MKKTEAPENSPAGNPEQQEIAGEFIQSVQSLMSDLTWTRIGEESLGNAERNLPYIRQGKSIADLVDVPFCEGDGAIIIAAGPSVHRNESIRRIRDSGYKGVIIGTESSFNTCLKLGLTPHFALSVDPHPSRIVRWFGDPSLTLEAIQEDDYYSRQDMDPDFSNELAVNQKILDLMAEHGHKISMILSSSASEKVARRVHEIGMPTYWWNPMMDDPDIPGSTTRALMDKTGLPSMNAGGNVGTASWMFADAVLGKKHVALVGFDFGYYNDTPYSKTQYYKEALSLVGEQDLDNFYTKIWNPYVKDWFYTDPAYYWYRSAFLDLAPEADCTTYNCTEGGILFGEGIETISLDDFLEKFS